MSFTDIVFLTYWKQDPPPAKRLWLTLSCYSLNCDGLEPKLQYLWGMPIAISYFMDGETDSGEMVYSRSESWKAAEPGLWGEVRWGVQGVWVRHGCVYCIEERGKKKRKEMKKQRENSRTCLSRSKLKGARAGVTARQTENMLACVWRRWENKAEVGELLTGEA